MSHSEDSRSASDKYHIITERGYTPTCQWCGTRNSNTWKHVIATGKFYCSDDCLNAAYYRCFISLTILSVIGVPAGIIIHFLLPEGDLKEFMLYVSCVSIVGIVAGLAYTRESKKIRSKVSRNSKSVKITSLE